MLVVGRVRRKLPSLLSMMLLDDLKETPVANSLVSITTTAKLIIVKNSKRIRLELYNNHASIELRIGVDEASLTATSGIPVAAEGHRIEDLEGDREYDYWGDYWGITASGTVTVSVMEQERVT
jgi:hypothetical protein